VLLKIFEIVKAYKPMTFFGGLGLSTILLALLPGAQLLMEYLRWGFISSTGRVVWCASCLSLGAILVSIGVTLHTVNFRFQEVAHALAKQIRCAQRPAAAQTLGRHALDPYTIRLVVQGGDGPPPAELGAAHHTEHPAAA